MIRFIITMIGLQLVIVSFLAIPAGITIKQYPLLLLVTISIIAISSSLAVLAGHIEKRSKKNVKKILEEK